MSFTKCYYRDCQNTSRDISMFRFPVNDPERLKVWIRNAGNATLESLTNAELRSRHICAAHFSKYEISKSDLRSNLIGQAIPIPFHHIEVAMSSDHHMKIDVPPSPPYLKVKTPRKFYTRQQRDPPSETTESPRSVSSTYKETFLFSSPKQKTTRKCLFEKPKRQCLRNILNQNENDSPKSKCLKSAVVKLQKNIRALKAKIKRLKAKAGQSKKVSGNKDYPEACSILVNMQKRITKKPWTINEKNFCLSLYYKSPSTYKFLRRQGVVLAAPSTIRMWLSKSSCLPGLDPQVFNQLNNRFDKASLQDKACVVSFDEMSIMKNFEYSKKYDIIEGYEDWGKNHRTNKIARYALVFVARGLYNNWKMPLAYFLGHSNMKAENLLLYVKAIINKLFDNGLLPKAIVCDQMTTNQKLFKMLGVSKTHPFFYCNERKLYALFDVPHLIKNVRNNFLTNDFLFNHHMVSFNDIVKTYEIDKQSQKSRVMTKITEQHLRPNSFQKMKVGLATQIFSNTVAAAILTAKSTGQIQSETATATANFIKIVNNLFDALNSKKLYSKNPYKCALSKKSTAVMDSIIQGKNMFEALKKCTVKVNVNGTVQQLLTRPPCFDGFVQSCKAIIELYTEESNDNIFFLLTSKLNQDVIENLFSRFREKGGANRNPTAKLLRTIFRSNLINSLIKLPNTKNCEDEQFIEPLAIQPGSTTQREVETEGNYNLPSSSCARPETSYVRSPSPCSPAKHESVVTLEECSVTYFAGYLAYKTLNGFDSCENCTKSLIKEENICDETQLLILNKSYNVNNINLKMPSDLLINLVDSALSAFNLHFESLVHLRNINERLYDAIINSLRCDGKEHLLEISCVDHIRFLLKQMINVKIHYFCKCVKRQEATKMVAKLRILQNK